MTETMKTPLGANLWYSVDMGKVAWGHRSQLSGFIKEHVVLEEKPQTLVIFDGRRKEGRRRVHKHTDGMEYFPSRAAAIEALRAQIHVHANAAETRLQGYNRILAEMHAEQQKSTALLENSDEPK